MEAPHKPKIARWRSVRRPANGSTSCQHRCGCRSFGGPIYACRSCESVVMQPPAPTRLIEGGLPAEATVQRSIP